MMVRWPGVIEPGSVSNEIISNIDWFPTLAAAGGAGDIKGTLAKGSSVNGERFKVKLDGHDFGPYFRGEQATGPRDRIMYFDQGGNLNAIRWNDWKLNFALNEGNIAEGSRKVTSWALITNLRMDPYERAMEEGGGYIDWYARQMWLLVPIQQVIKEFFVDFTDFPYQTGSSLNASNINYGLLRQQDAMKRLKDLEALKPR
jgi:arylsulfatase